MRFGITIRFERKPIRLQVEQVYQSDQLERYKVIARNKSLTLQSNRPLLKARGLKNKKVDWKLTDGQMHNTYILGEIIKALETYLKNEEGKTSGYQRYR